MFYEKDCWAVICYPICMTNVSYERGIIVLSFPDISFVILLFVFQKFEIKSGFPTSFFFNSYCIIININILLSLKCGGWLYTPPRYIRPAARHEEKNM